MMTRQQQSNLVCATPAAQYAIAYLTGVSDMGRRRHAETGRWSSPPHEHKLFMFTCDAALMPLLRACCLLPAPRA